MSLIVLYSKRLPFSSNNNNLFYNSIKMPSLPENPTSLAYHISA